MGPKCCAPGCSVSKVGKTLALKYKDRSLFTIPKDESRLAKWESSMPTINGRPKLERGKHLVCDLHFEHHFISTHTTKMVDGREVMLKKRNAPILTDGALPTLYPGSYDTLYFPNNKYFLNFCYSISGLPPYYSKRVPKVRRDPSERQQLPAQPKSRKITNRNQESTQDETIENQRGEETCCVGDMGRVRLPSAEWRMMPDSNSAPKVFYFLSNRILPGLGMGVHKCVKIDFVAESIELKVANRVVLDNRPFMSAELQPFTNTAHLEALLKNIDTAQDCTGIFDVKFEILRVLPIKSGNYESETWRSNS